MEAALIRAGWETDRHEEGNRLFGDLGQRAWRLEQQVFGSPAPWRERVQIPDPEAAYIVSYFMGSLCTSTQYFEVRHDQFFFFSTSLINWTGWKPGLTPSFDTVMSGNSGTLVSRWAGRLSKGSCRICKNVLLQNPCWIEIKQRISPAASLQINKEIYLQWRGGIWSSHTRVPEDRSLMECDACRLVKKIAEVFGGL